MSVDDLIFFARLERTLAPATCSFFEQLLPWRVQFVHVRWSGEACWAPLGDKAVPFGFENATRYPAPGQIIFYPGGFSETEMLLAYGSVSFASKLGPLAGNHFLTVTEGMEQLPVLGRRALWDGARDVTIERI